MIDDVFSRVPYQSVCNTRTGTTYSTSPAVPVQNTGKYSRSVYPVCVWCVVLCVSRADRIIGVIAHTTHNTQHTTHNTQHTTHNTQHTVAVPSSSRMVWRRRILNSTPIRTDEDPGSSLAWRMDKMDSALEPGAGGPERHTMRV